MTDEKYPFALIFISTLASSALLAFSGITKEAFLSPALLTGMGEKTSSINPYILAAAALLIPLAYAAASIHAIGTEKLRAEIALASAIAVPFVLYFAGVSVGTLVFSIAIVLSVLYAAYTSFKDKAYYKNFGNSYGFPYFRNDEMCSHFGKIDVAGVAKSAAASGIFLLNAAVAFAVFFALFSNPAYTRNTVDSMFKGIAGINLTDMENMAQLAQEQQRQASYTWLESIEGSLKDSVSQNLDGMTADQKSACENAVNTRMAEIDKKAKEGIDQKLAGGAIGGSADVVDVIKIITLLLEWFPAIMAITVFATLEFVRAIVLAPLAGLYAWALWKKFGQKKGAA